MDTSMFSKLVGSSQYKAVADDALKDEDNAAWVMLLEPTCRQQWIERIGWIRLVDRLAENELVDPSSSAFGKFYHQWKRLCQGQALDANGPYGDVLSQIHDHWILPSQQRAAIAPIIAAWNHYLESLVHYHRAGLVIETLPQYETMLCDLAGAFFQILPCLPKQYWQSVRHLGVLDQFYNNLRDMREDAEQGICYIPATILRQFGMSRSEILDLTACQNPNYQPMMAFWLNQLPRLRCQTQQFMAAKDLPICWHILRNWSLCRYQRIERIFQQCDYDYVQFPTIYWSHVSQTLPLLMAQVQQDNDENFPGNTKFRRDKSQSRSSSSDQNKTTQNYGQITGKNYSFCLDTSFSKFACVW